MIKRRASCSSFKQHSVSLWVSLSLSSPSLFLPLLSFVARRQKFNLPTRRRPLRRAPDLFESTGRKYRSCRSRLWRKRWSSTPWLFASSTRSTTYPSPWPASSICTLSSSTCCTNPSSLPICLYSFSISSSSGGRRNTSTSTSRSLANALFSRVRNIECTNPSLRATYSYTNTRRHLDARKRNTPCSGSSRGRATNT